MMSSSLRLCRLLARYAACALLLSSLFAPDVGAQEAFRDLYVTDNFVRSAAIAGDTLYVGGDFITVGPPTGPAAVIDAVTGAPDLSQARIGGEVLVVLPDGAGGWYVGGEFAWAGGEFRRNLAHVLADGSLNADFAPNPTADINPSAFGRVETLTLSEDGTVLYVGGRFDEVAGEPRQNLAAFDIETGALLPLSVDFERPGTEFLDVGALLHKDGVLYVGGDFDIVDGLDRVGAAALAAASADAPGTVLPWDLELTQADGDFILVSGFGVGPPPGDTTLYLGGLFDAVGGEPRPSGSAEVSLADPESGEGGEPTAWTTEAGLGGKLSVTEDVIWGPFFTISRETGNVIVLPLASEYTLASALTLDPTGGPDGEGVVYVSAQRTFSGDPYPSQYLVAVDAESGQRLESYFEGGELRVSKARSGFGIRSLAVEPGTGSGTGSGEDGRLFVGGTDLYSVGPSEPRRFLAGIDLTTGRVTPFNEEFVIFSSVEEVAVSPDERFLYFVTFNGLGVADLHTGEVSEFPGGGALAARLAAVKDDTAGDGDAASADSTSGLIRRAGPLATRADGTPLAPFTLPSGVAAGVARRGDGVRFRTNGSALIADDERLYFNGGGAVAAFDRTSGDELWLTDLDGFFPGPGVAELLLVEAGAEGPSGDTLFVAGAIRAAGDLPRDKFAALDAETGAVLDWNVNPSGPGNGVGAALAALGPPTDDSSGGARLFLGGGGLFEIGGEPRTNLVAVERSSAELIDWAEAEQSGVSGLAAQPGPGGGVEGGVVYAGGLFAGISGTDQFIAAALDAETGALIEGWEPAPTGNGVQAVLLAERQERVILVGSFTNSQRGSGHAFVTALTPARPFPPVASEPDEAGVPATAALSAAHPNPFGGRASLTLTLPASQRVEVALFDVLGRRVAVLHEGLLPAGAHELAVEADRLPSGVYFVRAQGEMFSAARRVTVVR